MLKVSSKQKPPQPPQASGNTPPCLATRTDSIKSPQHQLTSLSGQNQMPSWSSQARQRPPYTSDCHPEPRPRKDQAKPALSWRAQGSCPCASPFCMGFQVSWSLPGLCSASSDRERNSGLLLRGNIPAMTQIRKLVKNQMSTRKALFRDRL